MYFDTTKITLEQWEPILSGYKEGLSFRDLEKKFQVNRKLIAKKINELNLKRSISDQRVKQQSIHRKYQDDEILKLFNSGLNVKQVSVQLKLSGPTVKSSLLRSGLSSVKRKKQVKPKIKLSRISTIKIKKSRKPLETLDVEVLLKSYLLDKNSIAQTAAILKVGYGRVKKKLKELHVLRTSDERCQIAKTKTKSYFEKSEVMCKKLKDLSKEKLIELYIAQKLCAREIAESYNAGQVAVLNRLRKFDIPVRTKSEAFKIAKNKIDAIWPNPKNQKSCNTRPERCFVAWASQNSIEIEPQFMINRRGHRYDFKIKNLDLIIEIDGVYWHSFPEQKARDKRFDDYAIENGFRVLRFSDNVIYESNSTCFDVIIPIMNDLEYDLKNKIDNCITSY